MPCAAQSASAASGPPASTSSRQPSAMLSTRSTSPPKSACPGVSMMLIVTSPCRIDVFLARMVMRFSRKVWLCFSSASTSVVLPWSTWAMIATFRMSCRISVIGLGNIRGPMRFRACLPVVAALGLTSLAPVSVQAADEGWVITSFHAAIDINPDSSLDITENIQVDFGDQAKHGIFRTIPVRYKYDSTHDRYYVLKVESVTNGVSPVPYQAYAQGPDEVIKVGDPNRTVTGPNTY